MTHFRSLLFWGEIGRVRSTRYICHLKCMEKTNTKGRIKIFLKKGTFKEAYIALLHSSLLLLPLFKQSSAKRLPNLSEGEISFLTKKLVIKGIIFQLLLLPYTTGQFVIRMMLIYSLASGINKIANINVYYLFGISLCYFTYIL